MSMMHFNKQTVLITDAASEFGRACANLLALRGAQLVLNQPQRSTSNDPVQQRDVVTALVEHICRNGGKAIATYASAEESANIVDAAISHFGSIHALVINSSFGNISDLCEKSDEEIWASMLSTNIKGSYKCLKAAWPHFRKQGYGRVTHVEPVTGVSKWAATVSHSAAKMARFGFTETLAKEGAKYNIKANLVSPVAASYIVDLARPASGSALAKSIAALVTMLSHESNQAVSGSMFEVSDDTIKNLRWARARGAMLNPDVNFTPRAILDKWVDVIDISRPNHPQGPADFTSVLSKARALPSNKECEVDVSFYGKVVVVTGAGAGLGRSYALLFAKYGAAVVVNDLADPSKVVQEIEKAGGSAIACIASVEDGKEIVQKAIETYGRIDIVINNAGFVRDKAFVNMDEKTWDSILGVHLNGSYQVTAHAWPYFVRQGYGRIINTTSTSGIYGNFGQSNYAAAKLGILGVSDALAREGLRHNILVNTIAPVASTEMFAVALSGTGNVNAQPMFKPDYVAPLVALLSSDKLYGTPSESGGLFEVGCGWHAKTQLERAAEYDTKSHRGITPEDLLKHLNAAAVTSKVRETKILHLSKTEPVKTNQEILENIELLKRTESETTTPYSFADMEVILYNLSVGATRKDLSLVYENTPSFHAVPTFGVIPFFSSSVISHNASILPNFNRTQSLLGEHYLEIHKYPIPTSGKLISTAKLVDVIDKGSAAISITGYRTTDTATGEEIFYNEVSFFMRGAGGFGGRPARESRGPATRIYAVPSREPDTIATYSTSPEQAALYRLTGDRMAMHIDPAFSAQGGFPEPILHGACSMGIAGRQIIEAFGEYRSIKVRFAGPVVPGQTLRTEMWKAMVGGGREGERDAVVLFQVRVVETGKLCIVGGGAVLVDGGSAGSKL